MALVAVSPPAALPQNGREIPAGGRTASSSRGLQLPLSLYLDVSVSQKQAEILRELAQARPTIVRIVDEPDGAIHVLRDFELEEVAALERRRCRVIGAPFAERILRDPSTLAWVSALPLFDVIYRGEGSICCSGLKPADKLRCSAFARWMGARFSEDLAPGVGILVASRVSLHPDSKYQAALKLQIPIVQPSYLEAMWHTKSNIDMDAHVLSPLCGLGVCFDPRQAEIIDQLRKRALGGGAVMEALDQAEVVIVRDSFAPLYQEARKMGILVASPAWLERCLQLHRCVPITGDFEVLHPKSAVLTSPSNGNHSTASASGKHSGKLQPTDGQCGLALVECVLCLLYLTPGQQRDMAKALAWRCGAFTTLDPLDRSITHVLFRVVGKRQVQVSVPIEDDRVAFVDVSWLEACVQEGRRVCEASYPQQHVVYNPSCDAANANVQGRLPMGMSALATGSTSQVKLQAPHSSEAPPSIAIQQTAVTAVEPQAPAAAAQPTAASVQGSISASSAIGACNASADMGRPLQRQPSARSPPLVEQGIFAGTVLGMVGWSSGDADERALIDKIRSQGGTVVHGGSPADAVLDFQLDVLVCRDFGPPPISATRVALPLATVHWVNACLADNTCHPRSSFPHFEPGPGPLPLEAMRGCSIRITALEASSHRRRKRIEELVVLLGSQVAQQDSRWAQITHVVCVVPELLDKRLFEGATRRSKPVVTVQWLCDCFRMQTRLSEEHYAVSVKALAGSGLQAGGAAGAQTTAASFATKVLAGHEVLISPSALGSDPQLPRKAEELGAVAHTWRSFAELLTLLKAHGVHPVGPPVQGQGLESSEDGDTSANRRNVVVLLDQEEVGEPTSPIATFAAAAAPETRELFVIPSWLSETHRQLRRAPMEAFAALPTIEPGSPVAKRQRQDEATYAWQSAELTRLEQLAEDSKTRAMQSKVQQKLNEGLRLAELRQGTSRLGG